MDICLFLFLVDIIFTFTFYDKKCIFFEYLCELLILDVIVELYISISIPEVNIKGSYTFISLLQEKKIKKKNWLIKILCYSMMILCCFSLKYLTFIWLFLIVILVKYILNFNKCEHFRIFMP